MDPRLSPLLKFKDQFVFEPQVTGSAPGTFDNVIISGMGGSAISVTVLKTLFPSLPISLHNSYGLPENIEKEKTLLIVNSYSGNTEESLDVFTLAKKENIATAAISKGGKLLELAKESNSPYIVLPETDLEPRFAIGYQMLAILTLLGKEAEVSILRESAARIDTETGLNRGNQLSQTYTSLYPMIYTSSILYPVLYTTKAALNEGAKIPAFVNIVPEANHNELQGFVADNGRVEANKNFGFLFVSSSQDHERTKKRLKIMEDLYKENGFVCSSLEIDHTDHTQVLGLLFTGYAFATYLAISRDVKVYETPLIQEFKKRMLN